MTDSIEFRHREVLRQFKVVEFRTHLISAGVGDVRVEGEGKVKMATNFPDTVVIGGPVFKVPEYAVEIEEISFKYDGEETPKLYKYEGSELVDTGITGTPSEDVPIVYTFKPTSELSILDKFAFSVDGKTPCSDIASVNVKYTNI